MSSTVDHFSHPEHPLRLYDYHSSYRLEIKCHICNQLDLASPAYICSDDDCVGFYLHKSCAEFPIQIHHHKHSIHPLTLLPRPDDCDCDICHCDVKFSYACDDCGFDVCVFCAFEDRVLLHEGHKEHTLTLMQREACFECDACGVKGEDSSYVCTICQFWIHKECAFSPFSIPAPIYHHHPLTLIYSIPEMHRYFLRYCGICGEYVRPIDWLYYCHKCTIFVHMKCATSFDPTSWACTSESEGSNNEADIVEFPLHSEASMFDLIINQCCKLQVDLQGFSERCITMSTITDDPQIIEDHWSHKNHPLELHTISENTNNENDNDARVLVCDGCIQPITVSHPNYYACIQCGFFLHSFCATKLPQELPAGASPFHQQHKLLLRKGYSSFSLTKCGACGYRTNGFYYRCETCDIKIEIRCAFFPQRIKHESHRHSLVQRPFSNSICSVSKVWIDDGVEYACETCSSYQITIDCAFYPSRMKHKYDLHAVTLRLPPFFYEGVFYCEICEEQVDNQFWLYHCGECDHSFHYNCLHWHESIKMGYTTELTVGNQPHKLALVLKRTTRKTSPLYFCSYCEEGHECNYFFECDSCGILVCPKCVIMKSWGSKKSVHC